MSLVTTSSSNGWTIPLKGDLLIATTLTDLFSHYDEKQPGAGEGQLAILEGPACVHGNEDISWGEKPN
jgi:hypothetical protein